jgi:hypothetical protein
MVGWVCEYVFLLVSKLGCVGVLGFLGLFGVGWWII